jgi:NAD(P)-dependent dehydrogenase (short-subunit alcohol dehydrogenase family)
MTSPQTLVLITGPSFSNPKTRTTKLTQTQGANQGIGFEAAKNLLLSSATHHILLGSRDISKGEAAVAALKSLPIKGTVTALQIDITSDTSVDAAARHVKKTYSRLDIVVNNAGIGSQHTPSLRDAMREVFNTNVAGSVSVTEAFLPLLYQSASTAPRLIFVGSTTGSITMASDPNGPLHGGGAMDYRTSKAALNMVIVLYHNRLENEGIKVIGLNPGLIATNFHGVGRRPGSEPELGGERLASAVRGERDEFVGRVWGANGVLPW